MSNTVAADRLRSIVERIERVLGEIEALRLDVKEIKAEAKGEGFDVATINRIIKLRKKTEAQRQEEEALLDLYKAALGMLDGTPLGKAALDRLNNPPKDDDKPDDEEGSEDGGDRPEDDAPESSPPKKKASNKPADTDIQPDEAPDQAAKITAEDIEEARRKGGDDARAGAKILANPYVAGDPRRAAWDEGWCQAMGSDGMELPAALRPSKKPKKKKPDSGSPGSEDQSDDRGDGGDDA